MCLQRMHFGQGVQVMINNNNNNNHQLDQPVITRVTSPPLPIQKTALFCIFRFLIFHPFFQGSADPICPYVRTPMSSWPNGFTRANLCYRQIVYFNVRSKADA